MAEADDVPPLEDMSDLLHQVERLREQQENRKPTKSSQSVAQHNGTTHRTQNGVESARKDDKLQSSTNVSKSKEVTKPKSESSKGAFGGMKKGFLFGGSSSKSAPQKSANKNVEKKKETKTDSNDLTFIKKPEDESSSQFSFPEVQQAMKQTSSLLDNKEWVTDELLESVQKNERLTKRLQDPTFACALTEFQTNPQAASVKYRDNPEFLETFKDLCGIMGNHFGKLGEGQTPSTGAAPPQVQEIHTKKSGGGGADMSVRSSTNPNQPTAEDEREMQEILSNPEIRDILMDPWIEQLFGAMRTDPAKGQRFLQEADLDKRKKIQKLVDAGLLQLQR